MGKVFFAADLHLGHSNMAIDYRKFKSVEEHDNLIINNWNKVVNKKDKVFILGDITMENHKSYYLLKCMNGLKTVVGGNHDLEKDFKYLIEFVDKIVGCVDYKGFCLTHIPVHKRELAGRYIANIHGHVHRDSIEDDLYFNACLDVNKYTPVSLDYIYEYYENIKNKKL